MRKLLNVGLISVCVFSLSACGGNTQNTTIANTEGVIKEEVSESVVEPTDEDTEVVDSTDEAQDIPSQYIQDDVFDSLDESHLTENAVLTCLDYMYSWDLDFESEEVEQAFYDYAYYCFGAYPAYAVIDEDASNNVQTVWQGLGYRYGMRYTEAGDDVIYAFKWNTDGLEDKVLDLIEIKEKQKIQIAKDRDAKYQEFSARVADIEDLPKAVKEYPRYGICSLELSASNDVDTIYYDLTDEELDKVIDLIIAADRERLTSEQAVEYGEMEVGENSSIFFLTLGSDTAMDESLEYQVDIVSGYYDEDESVVLIEHVTPDTDLENLTADEVLYLTKSKELLDYIKELCVKANELVEG